MKGIEVTKGADIKYASDDDYVVNTHFLGGLKIAKKVFFDVRKEWKYDTSNQYYYATYSHGLPYVPAVLCFMDGFPGVSWQNEALVDPAANADATNVYMSCDNPYTAKGIFCLIVFGERVADA